MKRLFFISLFILAAAIIAYTVREDPHRFSESECRRCHIDAENNPKQLVASVTRLCRKCHRRRMRVASHPIDIAPAITRVPPDMPLTNGRLTCNTCHNVHAKRYTAFREKSYFLRRRARGKDFCASCHEIDPLKLGHKQLLDTAHMGRKYKVINKSQPLDPLSTQCIGCHDGIVGSFADYSFGVGAWTHNLQGPHPVGIHYNESRMKLGSLRPVSRLNRKIRFFGGRIGCGTCHDPYSKIPGQLVMSNFESRLCRECHYNK